MNNHQDKLIATLLKNLIASVSLLEKAYEGNCPPALYNQKLEDYRKAIFEGREYFLNKLHDINEEIENHGK